MKGYLLVGLVQPMTLMVAGMGKVGSCLYQNIDQSTYLANR